MFVLAENREVKTFFPILNRNGREANQMSGNSTEEHYTHIKDGLNLVIHALLLADSLMY